MRGETSSEVTRYRKGPADGATVRTALGPAGHAPLYGMLTDRLGVTWVLAVLPPCNG
ncbi:VOC family protein [Geodermatophilus marinus]|uniref:hypothetical protein n=1 Tax=Geodermatophilus sp. LHW52908 TaxID=2303986 RepID=UPI0018F7AFE4|nr:hypothetical protein [Geodermatophilus sp. LHW52908]